MFCYIQRNIGVGQPGVSLSGHRIVELNHHGSAVSELYGEPGMSGGAILGSAPISVIIDLLDSQGRYVGMLRGRETLSRSLGCFYRPTVAVKRRSSCEESPADLP